VLGIPIWRRVGVTEAIAGLVAAGAAFLLLRDAYLSLTAGLIGAFCVMLVRFARQALRVHEEMARGDSALASSLAGAVAASEATTAAQREELAALRDEIGALRHALAVQRTDQGYLRNAMVEDQDLMRQSVQRALVSGELPALFYTAASFDPETEVLEPLAGLLRCRTAIDVGANRGDFTAALCGQGFAVDAFEPLPSLAEQLAERFAGRPDIRVHALACSDSDGTATLKLATSATGAVDDTLFSSLEAHPSLDGLPFDREVGIRTARLDSILAPNGAHAVGLLKIDTEGHDISVLKGAGLIEAEALMVEFWEKEHLFNQGKVNNTLDDYLRAVDRKRFPHHVLLWRGTERSAFGWIVDAVAAPKASWGNILFLKDVDSLERLTRWAARRYGEGRIAHRSAATGERGQE
jgi:FkbM family methyltransferase